MTRRRHGRGADDGGLPLQGAVLALALPQTIIAWRTWRSQEKTEAVSEALGFAAGTFAQAGRDSLAEEETVGPVLDG
jgi:hypothetical protein